jgi:hypothetical protein
MITGADEKNGVFTSGRKMHNPVLVAKVQPYFLKHTPAGFAIMITLQLEMASSRLLNQIVQGTDSLII